MVEKINEYPEYDVLSIKTKSREKVISLMIAMIVKIFNR